jgi:hypothetical protein
MTRKPKLTGWKDDRARTDDAGRNEEKEENMKMTECFWRGLDRGFYQLPESRRAA